jgi:hypothetical protein
MPTFDSDVCIIGSGLSSAMLTEKLAEKSPGLAITVVEAGAALFDTANRIHLNLGRVIYPGVRSFVSTDFGRSFQQLLVQDANGRQFDGAIRPIVNTRPYGEEGAAGSGGSEKELPGKIRPRDLAMAGRIPGVTPAAVSILNVQLELRAGVAEKSIDAQYFICNGDCSRASFFAAPWGSTRTSTGSSMKLARSGAW